MQGDKWCVRRTTAVCLLSPKYDEFKWISITLPTYRIQCFQWWVIADWMLDIRCTRCIKEKWISKLHKGYTIRWLTNEHYGHLQWIESAMWGWRLRKSNIPIFVSSVRNCMKKGRGLYLLMGVNEEWIQVQLNNTCFWSSHWRTCRNESLFPLQSLEWGGTRWLLDKVQQDIDHARVYWSTPWMFYPRFMWKSYIISHTTIIQLSWNAQCIIHYISNTWIRQSWGAPGRSMREIMDSIHIKALLTREFNEKYHPSMK